MDASHLTDLALSYLAPLVQAIRAAEASVGRTPNGEVRALVLTPTSELAQQVLAVAKEIAAAGAPFRSSIITGEHKWRTQAKVAERGIELLVCTPGRLRAHLQAEVRQLFAPALACGLLQHFSTTHMCRAQPKAVCMMPMDQRSLHEFPMQARPCVSTDCDKPRTPSSEIGDDEQA